MRAITAQALRDALARVDPGVVVVTNHLGNLALFSPGTIAPEMRRYVGFIDFGVAADPLNLLSSEDA